jgi:hypothetical protein
MPENPAPEVGKLVTSHDRPGFGGKAHCTQPVELPFYARERRILRTSAPVEG